MNVTVMKRTKTVHQNGALMSRGRLWTRTLAVPAGVAATLRV